MKNNPTLSIFSEIASLISRYRGAILFWVYLMAIIAYATRWIEY